MPEGFPSCDLEGLSSDEVGRFNAIKTVWELAQPSKPQSRSRIWKTPQGYKFLVQWSNLVLLRVLIRKVTAGLPRSEYRLKAQADDAARSNVANLEEGWKRPTTGEYLTFLGYSQASLEEVKGDAERMFQDNYLQSIPESNLKDVGVDLGKWHHWCRDPLNSSKILYFPLEDNRGNYRSLKEIRGEDITYEMLIELINKTDWLLRKLVESLEKKDD